MNFDIKFDFQRRDRLGLIEAIWGQDKSIDQLERLCGNVLSKNEVVFITRINSEKANYLLDLYDDARFHEEANCLTIGKNFNKIITNKKVAIISGGSSDLAVTLEAQLALEFYGVNCQSFIDVGVAGLHRLMSHLEEINKYDVLIVCAGMELSLIHISEPTRPIHISYAVFCFKKFFLMIRRPPRSTLRRSSAASDVYKRQLL